MSQITGVERLLYVVEGSKLETWAHDIYQDGLGGQIIDITGVADGRQITVEFPEFQILLKSDPGFSSQIEVFGDHYLSKVTLGVENIEEFHRRYDVLLTHFPSTLRRKVDFTQHSLRTWDETEKQGALLKRIDHLTFPVPMNQMDSRRAFWEMLGGIADEQKRTGQYPEEELVLQGVMLENKNFGKKLGIALVAGVNGPIERAQVVQFLEANGLDQVQHIAFDVGDMEVFWPRFTSIGGNLLADPIVAPDGAIQAFGWPYSGRSASNGQYPEFLDRNTTGEIKFQQLSLEGLHEMQKAASKKDPKPLFDRFLDRI